MKSICSKLIDLIFFNILSVLIDSEMQAITGSNWQIFQAIKWITLWAIQNKLYIYIHYNLYACVCERVIINCCFEKNEEFN